FDVAAADASDGSFDAAAADVSDDSFDVAAADASDGSFDAAAADASDNSFEPAVADRLSCILPGYREITSCLILAERLSEARPKGYELGVKAAILRLISLLIPLSPDQPREESPYLERLKLVLNRVEQDYTHPLSIREISDFCGCSSSHFMRWFRQMTGSSFGHYVNERRLAYSAELLRQTDDKIISIAAKAGYDNLSNFNRQFKSRYGVTPGEYRKK
ncbi:MAG: AraC family transcriptional regulator, partial [Lachnospiraceae bacterium]|nr:AraC family transcriptional regulator [Lachnospiraceae bacterium]